MFVSILGPFRTFQKHPDESAASAVLGNSLEDFRMALLFRPLDEESRFMFCMEHRGQLREIITTLKSNKDAYFYYRNQTNRRRIFLVSYNDTIFKQLLHCHVYLPSTFVTHTFRELMRGITLFLDDDKHGHPAYHRSTSCGPKRASDTYFENNMNCRKVMDDTDEFLRRRMNTKNCYIERKVYDAMFKYHMQVRVQDLKHEHIKIRTERDMFETCWGSTLVDVNVIHERHCPMMVTIIYIAPTKTIVETYEKTVLDPVNTSYDEEVRCKRTIHDGESHVTIEEQKTQTFRSGELPWSDQAFAFRAPRDTWRIRHG